MSILPKKKVIWGNPKPHLNKELRKAIMFKSRFKNRANKSDVNIAVYKKQQNYAVALKPKYEHSKGVKPFLKTLQNIFF